MSPSQTLEFTRFYAVMGGKLRSEIEFPELPSIDAAKADWTVIVRHTEAPMLATLPLGERSLGEEHYRLGRTSIGFRLEYSHAGQFDVAQDGSTITWYPGPNAQLELARCIILGPALAIALEVAGHLCLHGSAVSIEGQAVAFVGGKYHGKSTLAVALTTAGAQLISDDLVAVDPGPPAIVRPGVASARLWQDTARSLAADSHCSRVLDGIKTTLTGFPDDKIQIEKTRLAAIYVLSPVASGGQEPPCRRTPLMGTDAAVALAHQTKLADSLVGYHLAATQLKSAVEVIRSVPVFKLEVARDLSRLTEVVTQLQEWHRQHPGDYAVGA